MGCAVMRFEPRKQVRRPLLQHYDGTNRPPHARPMPKGEAVKALIESGADGEVTAIAAREAMKRHRAHRLPGHPPASWVDAVFAGPPPFTSANAWSDEKVDEWAADTLAWLTYRLRPVSGLAVVTGAWLHRDERSPHLHVCLIPVLDDGTLGWYKVQRAMSEAGKAVCEPVTREEISRSMSALQTDYWAVVGRRHGLERGVKGSKRKHHRPIHDAPTAEKKREPEKEAATDEKRERERER